MCNYQGGNGRVTLRTKKGQLKPIQKVQAIRHVVTAKIQYYLHLSDHGLEEARKINRLVRKYVKKILPLLKWTSNAWVHHRDVTTDFVISTASSREVQQVIR